MPQTRIINNAIRKIYLVYNKRLFYSNCTYILRMIYQYSKLSDAIALLYIPARYQVFHAYLRV